MNILLKMANTLCSSATFTVVNKAKVSWCEIRAGDCYDVLGKAEYFMSREQNPPPTPRQHH